MVSGKIAILAPGNVTLKNTLSELRLRLDSLKHLLENEDGDRVPQSGGTRCF